MFETLSQLIDTDQATIGVIGLGYVGLPTDLAASSRLVFA